MVIVRIVESLIEEIKKKFSNTEANKIIDLIETLEENPNKGKLLGPVGGIVIKELKYEGFRFYFITDGFKLKCMKQKELVDLLIKFVRMSDKKHQQKVIEEIKNILITIGAGGFE
ncbi:MAG: hypothetical protein ABIH82_04640 [Candidatus Woesearchaeota archaeon]